MLFVAGPDAARPRARVPVGVVGARQQARELLRVAVAARRARPQAVQLTLLGHELRVVLQELAHEVHRGLVGILAGRLNRHDERGLPVAIQPLTD